MSKPAEKSVYPLQFNSLFLLPLYRGGSTPLSLSPFPSEKLFFEQNKSAFLSNLARIEIYLADFTQVIDTRIEWTKAYYHYFVVDQYKLGSRNWEELLITAEFEVEVERNWKRNLPFQPFLNVDTHRTTKAGKRSANCFCPLTLPDLVHWCLCITNHSALGLNCYPSDLFFCKFLTSVLWLDLTYRESLQLLLSATFSAYPSNVQSTQFILSLKQCQLKYTN